MEHRFAAASRLAIFGSLLGASGPALADVLDFEAPAVSSTIVNQYANQGVRFNGPEVRNFSGTPGFARSGNQAIEVCFRGEFCSTPLSVEFGSAQTRVAMWVGSSFPAVEARTLVLTAFDANGTQIGQSTAVLPVNANPTPTQIPIAVTTPTAAIRRVTLSFAAGPTGTYNSGLVIDDLEFDAAGFISCNGPTFPALTLSNPTDQLTVSANNFPVQGTVTTDGQLLEAHLTVAGSSGSRRFEMLGTTIGFSGGSFATQMSGALVPGSNQLTFHVRNCRGPTDVTRTVILSPIAGSPRFKLLGLEVVQATQDISNSVPLVADKPTIVRAFLGLEGSTSPVFGVAGDLVVTRPGAGPEPPVVHSMNSVTVDTTLLSAKRSNLAASLNFRLPPEHIRGGTLHLQLTGVTVGGFNSIIPCDGCGNLDSIGAPRWTQFQARSTLNLVVAPYRYTRAPDTQTPDLIFSPMAALQWTNNIFPLRGSFPIAGSGINLLRILPMRDTPRNLADKSGSGGDFLDELQEILNDLEDDNEGSWPGGVRLLAMTPCGCGGLAKSGGRVVYADIANEESGLAAQSSYSIYGGYWAHELAHTLGRAHAISAHGEKKPDSNFPYPHGGIGEPGLAITTEWWNGSPFLFAPGTPAEGQTHSHDLMSYGPTRWISPYTYKALFGRFPSTSASVVGPSPRSEQLMVVGHINADGTTSMRPLRRVMSSRQPPAVSADSLYEVQLIDGAGRMLASTRFDALAIADTDSLAFNINIPWHANTREIIIKGPKSVLARRKVSENAPWVRNIRARPAKAKDRMLIEWDAGDADRDPLHATLYYRANAAGSWLPLASVSGKNSLDIDTRTLPGSSNARLRVRISDGVNTSEATGSIAVPSKGPAVAILAPRQVRLKQGGPLELDGAAYDPEDGLINDDRLTWTTAGKRQLGKGARLDLAKLPTGSHVVILQAVDRDGQRGSARTTVIVEPARKGNRRP